MDFKQLESFISIVKYNSFSKAARELYLSQPTISNHIQNLEKELGIMLFNRKGKTIELTTEGKIFNEHAKNILKKRDEAFFELSDITGKYDVLIELLASSVPEETVLPSIIAEFISLFPGMKFKIHHLDSADVLDSIRDNKYNLGFVGIKPTNEFESTKVFKDKMVIIGPKSDKIHKELTFDEILKLPLIMREEGSGSGKIFSNELANRKLSVKDLNVVVICENFATMKKLVGCNVGYAIVPFSYAKEINSNDNILVHEIKDISTSRDFYFVASKSALLTPLELKFKEFILNKKF